MGHSAKNGCSKCKCLFIFEEFSEKGDYTKFNYEDWADRVSAEHVAKAKLGRDSTTISARKEIEKNSGRSRNFRERELI